MFPDSDIHCEDQRWMREALALARLGSAVGEVPVGAVVVYQNRIIGRGYNSPIGRSDPSAHAEMLALRDAAKTLKNYRLADCDLYVTLEPCTMCSGALIHSRIRRVIYGATEPKAGVAASRERIFEKTFMNHQVQVTGGVLEDECSLLLSAFFRKRRAQKKQQKLAIRQQLAVPQQTDPLKS